MRAREILSESLRFYAQHRSELLKTSALLMLPVGALRGLRPLAIESLPWSGHMPWQLRAGSWALGFVDVCVLVATWAVLIVFVASQLAGTPMDWRGAWRAGLRRARPIFTANVFSFAASFGIMVLAMLLAGVVSAALFPAHGPSSGRVLLTKTVTHLTTLYVGVRFAFVTCTAAIERAGGLAAWRRNRALLAGRFWMVAAVVVPIFVTRELFQEVLDRTLPGLPFHQITLHLLWGLSIPLEVTATVFLFQHFRTEAGVDPAQLARDLAD